MGKKIAKCNESSKKGFAENISNKLIIFILLIVILAGVVSLVIYLEMPAAKSNFSEPASAQEGAPQVQGQASINVLSVTKENKVISNPEVK